MTLKKIRDAIHADSYSSNGGVFTLRWGFFYPHGKTAQAYENKVKASIPQAVIVESGCLSLIFVVALGFLITPLPIMAQRFDAAKNVLKKWQN